MSRIFSLDIETRPLDERMSLHAALEPWRVRQRKAEISSVAVCKPNDQVVQIVNKGNMTDFLIKLVGLLEELEGEIVYGHETMFDLAFLIGTITPQKFLHVHPALRNIRWRDTRLLAKWLLNGQLAEDSKFSYSLINLCKHFLKDHPRLAEFNTIKHQHVDAGDDDDYWESRGQLDVIMTRALAEEFQSRVQEHQRIGIMTEFDCLLPIANSWVNGIKVDVAKIDLIERMVDVNIKACCDYLRCDSTMLSSTQRLGKYLFGDLQLPAKSFGKTGPSTKSDDLMWIHHDLIAAKDARASKMTAVMLGKKNKTIKSKYVDSLCKALSHTSDGYIYGKPRIFGTYTGRFTYSNSTTLKVNGVEKKFPCSIALHQLPRVKVRKTADISKVVKAIRQLFIPPDGFGLIENDASGQESRLMALRSSDTTMLDVFRKGLNFHSMTGSAISGIDYLEFQRRYKEEKGSGPITEQRALGKLTNLSCNYRISGRALAEKAFTDFDTFMTTDTGLFLVNTFKRQYSGVPEYWDEAIRFARIEGYIECFGGRRYQISKWSDRTEIWISESSAINQPIQGGGASMKEIAISELSRTFKEAHFAMDLHDASFNFCPIDEMEQMEKDMLEVLNSIDYERYWGFKPSIPLTYEGGKGTSFGDVK